jgi:hypothetical protein
VFVTKGGHICAHTSFQNKIGLVDFVGLWCLLETKIGFLLLDFGAGILLRYFVRAHTVVF